MMDCSEFRFEQLVHQEEATLAIKVGTKQFAADHKLTVRVVRNADDIPSLPLDSEFKYSRGTSGSLDDAKYWMEEGRSVWVVLVEKGGSVIGYGTTLKQVGMGATEVKIIDVDRERRRSRGLYAGLEIEGTLFQIGVAQVLVLELMENLGGPIETDATNSASRYVFKSLGFVHDETTRNPCLLRFETRG